MVRHPLYAGFFLAFWATPQMSDGHLLLAVGMSVYMLIAIRYEERDLVGYFGGDYEDYRATVGMLIPGIGRRKRPHRLTGSEAEAVADRRAHVGVGRGDMPRLAPHEQVAAEPARRRARSSS